MLKAPSLMKSIFYVFVLLVLRKIAIALIAMNTVRIHSSEVSYEAMIMSKSFREVVGSLPDNQETLVLILNKHALNMTFNWLCNTKHFSVTLDSEATEEIRKHWSDIRILEWVVPGLADPFNYGDGFYQLFYLFRSNLARALLSMNRTFWMIQQDTYWADNLLSMNLNSSSTDILFDRASENGPLIAGGYYRARPTQPSLEYFNKLSNDISWWYAPDNAYMTSLCQIGNLAACGGLPFRLITNWQWLDSSSTLPPPSLIQFDGETQLGGKLGKMRHLGFYFMEEDGRTCNPKSIETASNALKTKVTPVSSYSRSQFKMYQNIVDSLYSNTITAWLLNRWILPYAHFCMLSL
ncbi:unnamed protein product [Auanema sp. JU1783]|nr:unnamed protein product [Auanema sp. JU1783]